MQEKNNLDSLIDEHDILECIRKIKICQQKLLFEYRKLEIMTGDYVDKYKSLVELDSMLIKVIENINKEIK